MKDILFNKDYLKVSIDRKTKVILVECKDKGYSGQWHSISFSYNVQRTKDSLIEIVTGYIGLLSYWNGNSEEDFCKFFCILVSCNLQDFLNTTNIKYEFNGDYIDIKNDTITLFEEYKVVRDPKDTIEELLIKNLMNLKDAKYNFFGLLVEMLADLSTLFVNPDYILESDITVNGKHLGVGDILNYNNRYKVITNIQSDMYSDVVIIEFKNDNVRYLLSSNELSEALRNTDEHKVEKLKNLIAALV